VGVFCAAVDEYMMESSPKNALTSLDIDVMAVMFLCDYGGSYGTFRNIFTIVARERGGCETFGSGIERVNLRLFLRKRAP
jgi:hypothetical protein